MKKQQTAVLPKSNPLLSTTKKNSDGALGMAKVNVYELLEKYYEEQKYI